MDYPSSNVSVMQNTTTNTSDAIDAASEVLQTGTMSAEQSLKILQSEEARNLVTSSIDGIKAITSSATDLDVIRALLPHHEINNALAQNGGTIAGAIIMIVLVYSVFQGIKNSILIPITALVGSILTFFVWVNTIPFLEEYNFFAWIEELIRGTLGTNTGVFSFIEGGVEGLVMSLGWLADGWGLFVYVITWLVAEKIYFSFSKVASNNYIIDGAIVAGVSRVPMLAANTFFTVKVISIFLSIMTTFLISSAIFYIEFREGAWLERYTNIEQSSFYPKMLQAGKWFYEMVDINGFNGIF